MLKVMPEQNQHIYNATDNINQCK